MKTQFLGITSAAALGAFVTLFTRDASAAGTALDVQSARGTGMASATTAWVNDSTAIFYNPAGIAQGKGITGEAGITLIAPSFKFTSPNGDESKMPFQVVTPLQGYISGGLTDNLSVGIGVFTPYGLKIKWEDGWVGRSLITKASLQTFYFNPTVAYRFGPLRIGGGFQLVRATLELQKDINFGDQFGSADLGGGSWGYGGNVGVQLEAVPQYLSLGAHYRSAVKLDFDDADVHFNNVPRSFAGTLHDQTVSGSLTQPDSLAMGVSSRPIKDLNVAVDVVWYDWKHFKSIDLFYPNDATGTLNSSQAKNWHNTVNVHVGAEGALGEHWMLRGGVLYDPSPSPPSTLTPDVPDSTRINLAIGTSYRTHSGLHFDLGYQFIIITTRTSTAPQLPGDYGGFVNILALSAGFGRPTAREEPANAPMPEPPPPEPATPEPPVQPVPPAQPVEPLQPAPPPPPPVSPAPEAPPTF